jgi:membrane fusion protein, copper/silver efflux system
MRNWASLILVAVATMLVSVGATYWVMQATPVEGAVACPKPLYWYDPMEPLQHFERPGKSPFMDMALVPKCPAAAAAGAGGVQIDPKIAQNLAVRYATVTRGELASSIDATGVLQLNERAVAIVQSRTAGFVQRVYARATGDVIREGAPLVDLLVPEWSGAQQEFLALLGSGDSALQEAARQRLRLLGMPEALIDEIEASRTAHSIVTIRAPLAGMIVELGVRTGMTVAAGQMLARLNGLDPVWLEIAVPEAQLAGLQVGQTVEAQLPALPGITLAAHVSAILPQTDADSRTLTVRLEFPNPRGLLHPGLSARVTLRRPVQSAVLSVPTEAVIRTGKHALVLVAEEAGRYRPALVTLGAEDGERTAILSGLTAGQRVIASGQFLIDSEASLTGILGQAEALQAPGGASP